jgi:hypothetical protein
MWVKYVYMNGPAQVNSALLISVVAAKAVVVINLPCSSF